MSHTVWLIVILRVKTWTHTSFDKLFRRWMICIKLCINYKVQTRWVIWLMSHHWLLIYFLDWIIQKWKSSTEAKSNKTRSASCAELWTTPIDKCSQTRTRIPNDFKGESSVWVILYESSIITCRFIAATDGRDFGTSANKSGDVDSGNFIARDIVERWYGIVLVYPLLPSLKPLPFFHCAQTTTQTSGENKH